MSQENHWALGFFAAAAIFPRKFSRYEHGNAAAIFLGYFDRYTLALTTSY